MPDADYYKDLSLAEALRRLAAHHADPGVRHISQDEHDLLLRAAQVLETSGQ